MKIGDIVAATIMGIFVIYILVGVVESAYIVPKAARKRWARRRAAVRRKAG